MSGVESAIKTSTKVILVAGCVVPLALVAFLVWGLYLLWTTDIGRQQPNVVIARPEVIVQDARQLIERFRSAAGPARSREVMPAQKLPPSLQLDGVKAAVVFHDHLSLVMERDPDVQRGMRVWSLDAATPHRDETSAWPEIFWYRYCNDEPLSDRNQP